MAKPQLKSEDLVLFSAIILIAFVNKVLSTPKPITSLEELHAHCVSRNEFYSAFFCFHFEIQRSISVGIKRKNNLQ